jgi:hypothetical protein
MKNVASWGVKLFTLAFGIGSLIFGTQALFSNSSNWPGVQAEVLSVSNGTIDDSGSESYNVEIKYVVDGNEYTDTFSSSTEYSRGDQVTVYYDPQSPDSTVSSPGEAEFLGIVGILFGLFVFGSFGWGALKTWLAKRKKTETPATQ